MRKKYEINKETSWIVVECMMYKVNTLIKGKVSDPILEVLSSLKTKQGTVLGSYERKYIIHYV